MSDETVRVKYERSYLVRRIQTTAVDVPVEMLTDPRYFEEDMPTSEFDQWVCDNDSFDHEDYESCDSDDDLTYTADVPWQEVTDAPR